MTDEYEYGHWKNIASRQEQIYGKGKGLLAAKTPLPPQWFIICFKILKLYVNINN